MGTSAVTAVAKAKADAVCPEGNELDVGMRASRAGVMAAWTSLRFSLTFGGLVCTGSVGAVAAALPKLWAFDKRTDVNVAHVREIRAGEERS